MSRFVIYAGVAIGGSIGAYVPVALMDAGTLSGLSLICGFVGSVAGLWAGWKLTQWIDE